MFQVGDEFFEPLNIKFDERWRNILIVLIYFGEVCSYSSTFIYVNFSNSLGANTVLTILASRFLRFARR